MRSSMTESTPSLISSSPIKKKSPHSSMRMSRGNSTLFAAIRDSVPSSQRCTSIRAKDDLSPHDRVAHLRFEQIGLRHGVEIALDDREVAELPRLDRSSRRFFERGVGGAGCESADRF